MSVYIVVAGSLNNISPDNHGVDVKFISNYKSDCELYAEKFLNENVGAEVNIFYWRSGQRSNTSVHLENIWSPNYTPPVVPDEPEVVVGPETIATPYPTGFSED